MFVDDLRADLGNIIGEDLSDLPIIVGEVAGTFGSADANALKRNETFIEMQRQFAEDNDNVYTIASSQYVMNEWDEATGTSVHIEGSDGAHWKTEDALAIGELVGRCIIDNILK